VGSAAHDGELQMALRRLADWRKQREDHGDLAGLFTLSLVLDVQRQAVADSVVTVMRRQVRRVERGRAMAELRITPAFRERASRLLASRGANPFEAARFFRLPPPAQVVGMIVLEASPREPSDVLALISELEDDAERLDRRTD
jgi:hypothetical protein